MAKKAMDKKPTIAKPSYEEILEREKDKSLLLSISNDFATTKNRNDFFKIINKKISPLFNFTDIVVFIVDYTNDTYYLLDCSGEKKRSDNKNFSPLESKTLKLSGSVEEWIIAKGDAAIVLFEEFDKNFPDAPGIKLMKEVGLKDSMVCTLKNAGEIIGSLHFHSDKENHFTEQQLPLFKSLANQISVSVANILANEEILEREREKSELLSISEALASIKNTKDLFDVVFQKLKPLFNFDDAVIGVFDKSRQYQYILIADIDYEKTKAKNHHLYLQKFRFPHDDFFKRILRPDEVCIFSAAEEFQKNNNYGYLNLMVKAGIAETMCIPLLVGGDMIGSFFCHSKTKNTFQQHSFSLFKNAANQIATSIANIIANEEIIEREREKSQLLSITQAIATINSIPLLWQTINEKLKPIFYYDTAKVVVFDKEKKNYRLIENATHEKTKADEDCVEKVGKLFPIEDSLYELFFKNNFEPNIFSLPELAKAYPKHWGLETAIKFGLHTWMVAPLYKSGKLIGVLECLSVKENFWNESHLTLFKNTAQQISYVVANILATEEILEKEKEKSLLLSLSGDMASIRNKHDLWKVLMGKVKKILPFNESPHIAVLNSDRETMRILLVDPSDRVSDSESYRTNALQSFEYINTPFELCLNAETPVVYKLDYALEHYPQYWGTKIWLDAGIREMLTVQLKHAGKIIGALTVHSSVEHVFLPEHFDLFKSIADQVSIAVANILANEEILEREKEKSILLSIHSGISQIINREDLFNFIIAKIRPLFSFNEHTSIGYLSADRKRLNLFFTTITQKIKESKIGKDILNGLPVIGSVKSIISSSDPVIQKEDWKYSPKDNVVDSMAQIFWETFDIKSALSNSLQCQGKVIGTWHVHFNEDREFRAEELSLFKSISNIIAVAVANILANEEILEREREKSLELKILQEFINTETDLSESFNKSAQLLLAKIPFHLMYFSLVSNKGTRTGMGFKNNGGNKLIKINFQKYLQDIAKSPEQYAKEAMRDAAYFSRDSVLSGAELNASIKKFPLLKSTVTTYGLKSVLLIQNKLSSGNLIVCMGAAEENKYNEADLQAVRSLIYKMSIAIENKIVMEDNLETDTVKTFQIDAIKSINQSIPWHDRFANFISHLQQLIPFHFVYLTHNKINSDYGFGFITLGKGDFQYVNREHFLRCIKMPEAKYKQVTQNSIRMNWNDGYDRKQFNEYINKHAVTQSIYTQMDMKSNLAIPCYSSDDQALFCINLFSKTENFYTDKHFQLLYSALPNITEALYKNLNLDEIAKLKNLLEQENKLLGYEKEYLQQEINAKYNFEQIVGISEPMQSVFDRVQLVAPTDSTVLLEGETGTGKELIARAIHNLSRRKNKPLIRVNCAALPSALVESELFGHEKGSFTGALEKRLGKFELANGGTIFLDEIGDLSPEIQPKLLRVLQEREVDRIGSAAPIRIDVRIIAATNKSLEEECAKKLFRPDLYYRLNTFAIGLPALRERKEDIPMLADYFMNLYAQKMGKRIKAISSNALKEMMAYAWPGNVRELEHVIENAVIFCKNHLLELGKPLKTTNRTTAISLQDMYLKTLNDNEREHISKVLKTTKGRIRGVGGAAEILQIKPTTLESRMMKLGLKKEVMQ